MLTRKSSCVNARDIPPARGRKMLTPPPLAGPDPPPRLDLTPPPLAAGPDPPPPLPARPDPPAGLTFDLTPPAGLTFDPPGWIDLCTIINEIIKLNIISIIMQTLLTFWIFQEKNLVKPLIVDTNFTTNYKDIVKMKKSKVMSLISNCGPKDRLRYIRNLSQHIQVEKIKFEMSR